MQSSNLRYLQRDQINTLKWDQCITESGNELIYSYSFYLDYMSKHWDALVFGDYEAVMPLTWNRKYGIYYLYQPPFTASLGVFGKLLNDKMIENFLRFIPRKFRYIDIFLNYANVVTGSFVLPLIRNNYILNLNRSYEALYKNYRENIRRNIKKSQQLGCLYRKDIPVEEVIHISKSQMKGVTHLTGGDYENFKNLYEYLYRQGKAMTYGIFTPANELVSSCVYFFSGKRAYYILAGNHPNGKTMGASHYLIDRFIAEQAGRELLLDFEGSDIRNLAFFYSSFGAEVETYPAILDNRLPWWMKWLKRS